MVWGLTRSLAGGYFAGIVEQRDFLSQDKAMAKRRQRGYLSGTPRSKGREEMWKKRVIFLPVQSMGKPHAEHPLLDPGGVVFAERPVPEPLGSNARSVSAWTPRNKGTLPPLPFLLTPVAPVPK